MDGDGEVCRRHVAAHGHGGGIGVERCDGFCPQALDACRADDVRMHAVAVEFLGMPMEPAVEIRPGLEAVAGDETVQGIHEQWADLPAGLAAIRCGNACDDGDDAAALCRVDDSLHVLQVRAQISGGTAPGIVRAHLHGPELHVPGTSEVGGQMRRHFRTVYPSDSAEHRRWRVLRGERRHLLCKGRVQGIAVEGHLRDARPQEEPAILGAVAGIEDARVIDGHGLFHGKADPALAGEIDQQSA